MATQGNAKRSSKERREEGDPLNGGILLGGLHGACGDNLRSVGEDNRFLRWAKAMKPTVAIGYASLVLFYGSVGILASKGLEYKIREAEQRATAVVYIHLPIRALSEVKI